METQCIRYTDLPHSTRLFTDLVYHPDRVAAFYPHLTGAARFRDAGRFDYPDDRRRELIRVLAEQNPGNPDLDRLAQPGAFAVVTGQQVGLFSGPAYTIYKALTAVRLAAELTAGGLPAVPVFWLATEDHDLAEVDHCWAFDAGHGIVRLAIAGGSNGHRPVGGVRVEAPVEELRRTLAGFDHGAEVADLAARAYAPGADLGTAFRSLLESLLGRRRILFFDPMRPAARKLAAPLMTRAVESAGELTEALLERNRSLQEAGYHAQVHVERETSLVFLLDGGRRIALRRAEDAWSAPDRLYSAAELAGRAADLSPNALLRPVAQDYMLPTIAYVGGPAELAYLAQAEVIYQRLLGRMPAVVPRTGFTVLDGRSAKLLARYGLPVTSCFHGEEELRGRMAERLIPESLMARFGQAEGTIEAEIARLDQSLAAFDPTLSAALETSRRKIRHQLSKIRGKTGSEAMRRQERSALDAAHLVNLVYPHKHMQERFYTILPFVARYGLSLIDRLWEGVRLDCPDHQVVEA